MAEVLDIEKITGLTSVEAQQILEADGYNELPSQKKQNFLEILVKVLAEPMLLLLIGCGVIYLFLGEQRDAVMLISFVLVVVGITFYQERKTEKTLEALKNLASPRALVIRDGERRRIPGREVVKNDIIMIKEGDRVPADAVMLSSENVTVDESWLTGESIPVRKETWDGKVPLTKPGGDGLAYIFSGSMVVSGRGIARVLLTGLNTEFGKIGKSLETIKDEETLLRKETAKIVSVVAVIGIGLCIGVVIFYAVVKGAILQGILSGLTLSMAVLPEEFPVVLIIFLTLGAWRISKKKVLTRRPAAIETLGAATVLCTDKTGTLTLNQMKLASLYCGNNFWNLGGPAALDLPENFHELLEYAVLASKKDPFDPIEKELNKIGLQYLKNSTHLHKEWIFNREYPLSKNLLALSHVWQSPNKKELVIAAKGAPEAILELCHLPWEKQQEILAKVEEMSDHGLRVLAVAKAGYAKKLLPNKQHEFNFEFTGLLGFVDPARTTAAAAIKEAYGAGIRVIMVTGDYPGTAQYIAREIGIKDPEIYISGDQLEKMTVAELAGKIRTCNIFARVVPEQKLLIINALKANGEIVAMTGDGVNDAPALKAANIGIAMGERGTDVAREAAALVLLNDDFSAIVAAVRLGRRIFDNLKRAMGYILAVHVPIAGMALLPLALDLPPVLLPAHIAFLELIIDPACSTVFEAEAEDSGIMKRPPRNLTQSMLDKKTILMNLLQGAGVLVMVFWVFWLALKSGRSETYARSLAFTALVLSNLMLILVNLSWTKNLWQIIKSKNKILWGVLAGAIICLVGVLQIPVFSDLFHLTRISAREFAVIAGAAVLSLSWFEVWKSGWNKG